MKSNNFLRAIALLVGLSASGCAPLAMTREAQGVVMAERASNVESCKPRGTVFALAPFSSIEEPLEQLKIRANGIGANTIVLINESKTRTKDWSGRAYRCGTAPARAAEPATGIEAAPSIRR